jgi:hydroxyacylglutathione hydrolase
MREQTFIIVGGGASGTLTAYHLARSTARARIVLVEPGPRLGLGLAYATPSLRHLLNVPAGRISALPDQPLHFLHWAREHYDAAMTETDFAPRAVYGRYIQSLLAATAGIEHVRAEAVDCRVQGRHATVILSDGRRLTADAVILATGNFDPAPLRGVDEKAAQSGAYQHSAFGQEAYRGLNTDAPVALIGTGLTAVDVILRLRETGHRGTITAISRHGIFPHRHAAYEPLERCVVSGAAPKKARTLLRAVHIAIRHGQPWRAVVDSLRARTNELWLALPAEEQRRFRRHLQRRWDVVRHRMAPPIADAIEAELRNGTLVVRTGSVEAVTAQDNGAVVRAQIHGGERFEVAAARVINCTGPAMNYRRVGSALLNSLFAQGLISPGPLGGGLWSNEHGALRAEDGTYSRVLFNLGPGRQGTLLESIAMPELRVQAAALAERLAARELLDPAGEPGEFCAKEAASAWPREAAELRA